MTAPPPPQPPAPVVEAIKPVRRNTITHAKACANHETSTIQYLIMPMLQGVGWNEHDPEQIAREYRPKGKSRYGNSIAVDIALLQNSVP